MPRTLDDINRAILAFHEKADFPRVIGTVDGTHIRIQSSGGEDAEIFRNRKSYYSINVQVIASADLKLQNIVARWPGSTHDVTIFNNSNVKEQFENNYFPNCVLLGDSGYYLKPYLLTPLLNPVGRAGQLYNASHITARNTVERLIGVWKRRFPILAYGCRLKLDTTMMIVIATGVLHNICRSNNEEDPPDPEDINQFLEIMEDRVPNIAAAQAGGALGIQTRRN